jgi:hypothetical protein
MADDPDDDDAPSPGRVVGAAIDVLQQRPDAHVFIYIATPGSDDDPVILASGDDDDAAELLAGVHAWIGTQFEDADDED